MIISISPSPLKTKRFRVLFQYKSGEKKNFDFGYKDAKNTYIDGASDAVRANYLKRHMANPIERRLITEKIASPALFSARLIWGRSRDINANIRELNREWLGERSSP